MSERTRVLLGRLVACEFGGVVLALMIGNQEGTLTDFGVATRDALSVPRIFLFLIIGLVIFALITFWPLVDPYLSRPGVRPLGAGLLVVIAGQTVMNWYDPLASSQGSGKFNAVRSAVSGSGVSSLAIAFFSWLAWTLFFVGLLACGAAIVTRLRPIGYLTALVGVTGAVLSYTSHTAVVNYDNHIDHSLGMYANIVGFLVIAGAGVTAVHARSDSANTRAFARSVMGYRPGLPFAVLGLILGLLAFTTDGWFGSLQINYTLADSHTAFAGQGLSALASQYLAWLGWTIFAVSAVLALAASWLRNRLLAWAAGLVALVGVILTFFTLRSMTEVGASVAPVYGTSWKNLGAGGFMTCIVFSLFASAASVVVASCPKAKDRRPGVKAWAADLPVTSMVQNAQRSTTGKSLLIIGGAVALFYPPTLTLTWQNVLVSQIGVFVLLALGLNVVVGWAGLLDLGYIAFYEIGSYTTAYLVGALPVKPPSWLQMSPLLTIPFAIVACLIAGVLLGAPTLRLRGDYLAIVTLGFGEIIQISAVNDPGGFTGGPQGPTVPHPRIRLGGFDLTWGQDFLPYWYLLLIILVIVIVLFYRLEGSRLGRAWAAIREDEVAAQASGVNTSRVKLLAFAIGASTSALAGSFFATQVGYFDPSLFTLQASILIVAYVVFGGMGSLQGAMAGAAALTWLPQFLKAQVPQDDRQMWIGALVLAMMIFRPAGLLPAKRRKAELEGLDSPASSEVSAVPASGAM
ncbi:MAG: branched-chain amino acid ABC transporter permease [Jatrophihabitantaceae bacterium]